MACLDKRGDVWWVKFHDRSREIRQSLKTTNRQLARESVERRRCECRPKSTRPGRCQGRR
jgi:hypothetical protein